MHYARGKTLGGSSARNYLLYQRQVGKIYSLGQRVSDEVPPISLRQRGGYFLTPPVLSLILCLHWVCRGTIDSYQRWADEVDDQSYAWEAFLPYLQKSVHYTSPNLSLYTNASNLQTPDAFSATGGPLQVSFSNDVDAFGTWASKVSGGIFQPKQH